MPLNLPEIPAIDLLKQENIFVMNTQRASSQDIRPLKMLIVNLMPIKITTETDLVRLLSNTPLQIEIDFLKLESHVSKNTPIEHLKAFYRPFSEIKEQNYDGMIITGAPVEMMPFEEVNYWHEITTVFDWARTHVTSSFFVCWAAQAGLYHYYGIPKYELEKKKFGVFSHQIIEPQNPIFRGFDDEFFVPHSRHTTILKEDVEKVQELTILSESKEAGIYLVVGRNGREFFVTGHPEYSPNTLGDEYHRDVAKGLDIDVPQNYFPNNDPTKPPLVRWRGHANLLYSNWLNYFVYQETPYNISDIR